MSLIRQIISSIMIKPGFDPTIFNISGNNVSKMPINSNLSCVAFDEMSLQEYINQCRENGSLEGLEDFGSLGKTNKN